MNDKLDLEKQTDTIKKYYLKYNMPSADKLYQILKTNNIIIPKKYIQEFLNNQTEYQQLKPKLRQKKKEGHHIAFGPMEICQIDIYDLSKYVSSNKNYKYIFALVDVFTRRAFCVAMKTKETSNVVSALKSILDKVTTPKIITSDSDTSFLSKEFTGLLEKHNIILDNVVAMNDHRSLAIIDRFALTLKTILSKEFIRTKTTKWIDRLDDVVKVYNETPHSSLDGLTPDEAELEANRHAVVVLNRAKLLNQSVNKVEKPEFKPGDFCRVAVGRLFRKGTEPKYSDDAYEVASVAGQRVTLTNGKTYLVSKLLKVSGVYASTAPQPVNPIEKVNKENRVKRAYKKTDFEKKVVLPDRAIRSKRAPKKLDL
jgi:hypothetical protein